MRIRWPHTLLPATVLVLTACGRSKGGGGGSSGPAAYPCTDGTETFGDRHAPLSSERSPFGGVTVRLNPFANANQMGLVWSASADESVAAALRFAPPVTVEGFHWPWSLDDKITAPVWTGSGGTWQPRCRVALTSLADRASGDWAASLATAQAVGFGLNFANPPGSAAWPAVVGVGNGDTHVLSLLALSPVMPARPGAPLRLEILGPDPASLAVYTRARSCGTLCFEYGNYLDALDTPFLVTRAAGQVLVAESSSGSPSVRLVGFARTEGTEGEPTAVAVKESCSSLWQQSASQGAVWLNSLATEWGTPETLARGFDIYLSHRPGTKTYQGLEHSGSTIVTMGGDCAAPDYSATLSRVIAHEMIHVWNVRHLYPAEHAVIEWGTFDPQRIRQLFLYEGWTEGYARFLLAEEGNLTPAAAAALGNNALLALYRGLEKAAANAEESLVLNRVDPNNAFGHYESGAGYLLVTAMKLRALYDAPTARAKTWRLLSALRSRADRSATENSWVKPPWLRRAWDGLKTVAGDGATWGQGYRSEDVVDVVTAEVGALAGTSGSQVGLTAAALTEALQGYAAATGVQLAADAKGRLLIKTSDESSLGALRWPFAPLQAP